ncbi:MAG: RNA polymerase-binding protein DksA [Casimicrobiaceae bacterium]|nr:RNA polymerase-binding protein DksA [Casimicrobiaceae bacterium]MCX8098665.1 RNA polymerase-binding protein DksA [Casimicrobiaceae bacterium]
MKASQEALPTVSPEKTGRAKDSAALPEASLRTPVPSSGVEMRPPAPSAALAPAAAEGRASAEAVASETASKQPLVDLERWADPPPPQIRVDPNKRYGPLTEAEILAMPESEYMNRDQLEFFRAKLTELYQQILANASDTGDHLREVEIATDPSDRATQEEEYTLELRTRDRERKLLKKVEKALRMIDEGTFGYCEETGEPIGIPRLLARPTATLSIEAQERRERMQRLYGD